MFFKTMGYIRYQDKQVNCEFHEYNDVQLNVLEIAFFSSPCNVWVTNKTDRHDITEILLKVVLNTISYPNLLKQGQTKVELLVFYVHHSMHALSFEHTHLLRGNVCATK
jgi:hypothetical protein